MHHIEIEGISAHWGDDALSLSLRSRLIAWGAVAALTGSLALVFFPLWLKLAMGAVAALTFLMVAMDSGWRQKQDMELRYATETVCHVTGLPAEQVRPALLRAAEGDPALMPSGHTLTLHPGDKGFLVTISQATNLQGEVLQEGAPASALGPLGHGSYVAEAPQGSVSRRAIFGGGASSPLTLAA